MRRVYPKLSIKEAEVLRDILDDVSKGRWQQSMLDIITEIRSKVGMAIIKSEEAHCYRKKKESK